MTLCKTHSEKKACLLQFNDACAFITGIVMLLLASILSAHQTRYENDHITLFKNPDNPEHEQLMQYIINADARHSSMQSYKDSFSDTSFSSFKDIESVTSARIFLFVSAENQNTIETTLEELNQCKLERSEVTDSKALCQGLKQLLTAVTRPFITHLILDEDPPVLLTQFPLLSQELVKHIYGNRVSQSHPKYWYAYDRSISDPSQHNATTSLHNELVTATLFIQDWSSHITGHEWTVLDVRSPHKRTNRHLMTLTELFQNTLYIINRNYLSLFKALNEKLNEQPNHPMIIALMALTVYQKPGGGLWQADNLFRKWIADQPVISQALAKIYPYRQYLYLLAGISAPELY